MNRPTPAQLQHQADAFNSKHKVGDPLWAYRGPLGENPIAVTLRTPAEVLSGHTAVAWVDGTSGCIAVSHLKARHD